MLASYSHDGGRLDCRSSNVLDADTVWIDLVNPTAEEDASVERLVGVSIPTRDEAREIEDSSRLYRENGASYMTAFILYNLDAEVPAGATLTFVLTDKHLVTIRYHEPRAFPIFAGRAARGELECATPSMILVGLLETLIERAADLIERTQDRVEITAQGIFSGKRGANADTRQLGEVLRGIGRQGDITARLEESAFSLERLFTFLTATLRDRDEPPAIKARLKTAQRDLRSLSEQMRFLTDRITFLLDATLGAISIEQNQTMKLFSLLAVTLMPPTLVGSIYGMNFKHIPELDWDWGYPMALGIMLLSGLLPYLYFRAKRWI